MPLNTMSPGASTAPEHPFPCVIAPVTRHRTHHR
ncbi:hypothetical protein Ga0074812_105219 [Parafrankia irregularis]|uniref:Uncharacterized protein n=1 Tax=Parafrankia irregularis TaxID=795642 RepID=A0A0S4QKG7_9ACTN|nr:hypothetical protein FrEUN1fDRAFT_4404 [Parafrankia sp. EUN1f]CUU55567.1 hypothetical protein Ga0074812_105219 [Parafrankia irregularis]